jgi:hypothetical protein
MDLRNVGILPQQYMTSQPRRARIGMLETVIIFRNGMKVMVIARLGRIVLEPGNKYENLTPYNLITSARIYFLLYYL